MTADPAGAADTAGPSGRRVVLATLNEHKVHELRQILAPLIDELGLEVVSAADYPQVPDVAETEVSFLGNARLKAKALAAATGLPALADDSGLAVEVLGGCPGIFSARWSGRPDLPRAEKDRSNLELLLAQLADVPDEHRSAAFVCAAVLVMPDGSTDSVEGRVAGSITREPRGTNGFGYDPIFLIDSDAAGRTMAELTDEQKNAISHRGRAFETLLPILRNRLA